jgi:hypothetical protein
MHRLKIQRVRRVPPIPTTIIVIPNVQLSIFIFIYLLMKDSSKLEEGLNYLSFNSVTKIIKWFILEGVSRMEWSFEKRNIKQIEDSSTGRRN